MLESRTAQGITMALTATIIWSGNFIIAKSLIQEVSPAVLSLLRWGTACLVLLPFGLKSLLKDWPIIRKHLKFHFITALLGISLFNTCVYLSARHTSGINMVIISSISPIITILLAGIFLKEPLSFPRVLGMLLAFSGVLTIASNGDWETLAGLKLAYGDILACTSALLFGGYSVLVRLTPKEESQLGFLTAIFIFGVLWLIPMAGWEIFNGSIPQLANFKVIWSVLYIGIGASVVSFFLWNMAVGRLGPSKASAIYYTLPMFGCTWAVIFLNEQLIIAHILGGILILLGVAVATKS